jgi:hypothetical protein
MPTNNGLWLHEDQRALPSRPKAAQHHPEELVKNGKLRQWVSLFQDASCRWSARISQEQVAAGTSRSGEEDEQERQQAQHEAIFTRRLTEVDIPFICPIRQTDRYLSET